MMMLAVASYSGTCRKVQTATPATTNAKKSKAYQICLRRMVRLSRTTCGRPGWTGPGT